MNKSDLVDAVASRADMSKAEAGRAVDAVLGSVGDALGNGNSVSSWIRTFSVSIEQPEWVETHRLELQCILRHQKFLVLKLVKL